jgi:peroxiredoxin
LRQDFNQFIERNSVIVAVGPENAPAFNRYWEENDLPYIGLPNPDFSVLKSYGQEINLFKFGRMPAQVVIDRQGIARFVHYGNSMSDIPENEEILVLLDQLNQEESE